jgi:hypothetical protein
MIIDFIGFAQQLIGSIGIAHIQTNRLTGRKKREGGRPIDNFRCSLLLPHTLVPPLSLPSLSLSIFSQATLSIFFGAAKTSLFRSTRINTQTTSLTDKYSKDAHRFLRKQIYYYKCLSIVE